MNAGHAEALARARMQQHAKLQNTRPLDENGSLFGALERSADALNTLERRNSEQKRRLFQEKAFDLGKLAISLKQYETSFRKNHKTGFDSVDAVSMLLQRAAVLSKNDPDEFVRLVNEILIGDIPAPGIPDRVMKFHRIEFGDLGMNSLYQDHTAYQMTHFWAYVNYGFYYPKNIAKIGNIFHEFTGRGNSKADLRLGVVGYNFGESLKENHFTPEKSSKILEKVLRTDQYNTLQENNLWLQNLPGPG